ncbi:endonuclease/exonuclease/phosphatase family protein [Dethiosulfovibrio sp. F2B]|uniref:endonuclease/exonuclease/phosphatase family protein n=1 Tax=Dethiosulfovibrio faecalis TaxID=2720018 RepID=UPI001F353D99|nr:endonuclease/exonuclease/phosphatase family protein [Dethiosulfovibrio faecalis]MCF4151793.1 endonuclease/exonuclease/phosphatase family protein [Dethiosulfovibrio faecalis]
MTKLHSTLFAILASILLLATPSFALSIGTFNIEYFNVSGKKAYSPTDCAALAKTIRGSGADVLALQEIEGNTTMRYFVTKFMPGWAYAGNDTGGRQDLYFLWNKKVIKLLDGPHVYGANASFRFEGKSYKLNDRPNLVATFLDTWDNTRFTLVNVHLKSQSTRGKDDKATAQRYNDTKRRTQIEGINKLVSSLKGPVFVLGDYNTDSPTGTAFPLVGLHSGHYSYDNRKSNLDYIGYMGIQKTGSWKLYEVESSIASRSTRRSQYPDHDIVVLSLDGDGPHAVSGGIAAPQVVKQKKVIASDSPNDSGASGDTIVYITKTGKKYHADGCSYLKKSKIPITLKEAKAKGYTPCSKCHPPK